MCSKPDAELESFIETNLKDLPILLRRTELRRIFVKIAGAGLAEISNETDQAFIELSRMVKLIIRNISEQIRLIMLQLQKDMYDLELQFGELGEVIKITGPHSDFHEQHSAVYILHFRKQKLVYKPRSLKVDSEFAKLCSYYFGAPQVGFVLRQTYGWMEFFTDDSNPQMDIKCFGECLALCTILRSSDHHKENIITVDCWPKFVDLECSIVPEMTFNKRANNSFSPVATRMLTGISKTDKMDLARFFSAGIKKIKNAPQPLMTALQTLKDENLRVVLRQSAYYETLLEYSCSYEFLKNPDFRYASILKHLKDSAPQFPEVCEIEARLICDGIIPKFTYQPLLLELEISGKRINGLISKPGLSIIFENLQRKEFFSELFASANDMLSLE
jgi:lantibiotic modifying enzyme